jgi:hypothetical protein
VVEIETKAISPNPSSPKRGKRVRTLPKRGREKPEMTHSVTRRAQNFLSKGGKV